jgi:hypothetical protein
VRFDAIVFHYAGRTQLRRASEKGKFTSRLRRDWYAQLVPSESGLDTRWLEKLPCSICHDSYPRAAFTPPARAQCAETRACISTSARLQACKCWLKSLSFRQVLDIKQRCDENAAVQDARYDATAVVEFCDNYGAELRKYCGTYKVAH